MSTESQERLLLLAGLVPAVAVAGAAYLIVPQFIATYAAFDLALPLITRILFASYRWSILLPILVVLVWQLWPKHRHPGAAAAIAGSLLSALAFAFGYWSVYQPMALLATSG